MSYVIVHAADYGQRPRDLRRVLRQIGEVGFAANFYVLGELCTGPALHGRFTTQVHSSTASYGVDYFHTLGLKDFVQFSEVWLHGPPCKASSLDLEALDALSKDAPQLFT